MKSRSAPLSGLASALEKCNLRPTQSFQSQPSCTARPCSQLRLDLVLCKPAYDTIIRLLPDIYPPTFFCDRFPPIQFFLHHKRSMSSYKSLSLSLDRQIDLAFSSVLFRPRQAQLSWQHLSSLLLSQKVARSRHSETKSLAFSSL